MPRVHFVKKARKDNPAVKKGEPYYWWKFRYGGKRYSATYPRGSELTQSPYYGAVRSLLETIEDFNCKECEDESDFESFRDEVVSELESLAQECQDNLDNMPESLTYSPTGELLQERIDACEAAQSEIECMDDYDFNEDEPDRDDEDFFDEDEGCFDEEAFNEAVERYEELKAESFQSWLDEKKTEMSEAVGNCEV